GEQADIGNRLLGVAILRLVSHHHVISLFAEEYLADGAAAHGRLNRVLYVGHVNSKTGRLPAVDGEVEIRLAESVKELEVHQTRHVRHGAGDFVALIVQSLQILPEKLERQLTFCAGDGLTHVIFDGLGEIPEGARDLGELAVHRGDQLLFVPMEHRPPLLLRLEVHEILGVAESAGVGTVVGAPHFRHDFGDLGKGRENQSALVREAGALSEIGAVGQGAAGPDGAFVEVRQELRPDDPAERQVSRYAKRRDSGAERDPAMADRPAQVAAITGGQKGHHGVAPFANSFTEDHAGKYRRDEDGKHQRAQQGEGDRQGHGPEQPALYALQREDGQVGGDDDGDGVKHRALHLMGGVADDLGDGPGSRGHTVSVDVANGVLYHDDRAIHHHAEIERTEGKQVGRNMADVEPDGGEQQRERDSQGHDQIVVDIAEEQEKNDGHQDHAFTQVVHHRVQGVAQEIGAIQHGDHLHAGRQDTVIELFHLLVDALQCGPRVGAFAHQHDALNDVGFVDDASVLHVVGPGHVTQTNFGALRHFGYVLHPQGGPFLRLQDGLLDVADIAEKAERADVHLLQAGLHEAAAGVDIVAGELLLHLTN